MLRSLLTHRFLWAAFCGLIGWGSAGALQAASAPELGPIVELPKFVVTDSRMLPPPESWRYATMPGFEILSNASDSATQRLIRDFDMFRQALGHVWPTPDNNSQVTSLIICGRGNTFESFIPPGKSAPEVVLASLLLKQSEQAAIVVDLQATTLKLLDVTPSLHPTPGTDDSLMVVAHDQQLYREYVRYLLSKSEPRMPPWFEEGLAQIIMKMKFSRRYIEFARLENPNAISAEAALAAEVGGAAAPAEDRDFAAALRGRALVPLDQFFAVGYDSPEALNPLGNNRWAKQAYAFVHMCLYGENGKYQKAFGTFLMRAARETVTEALFQECFNMSYRKMLEAIRNYCDFTVYKHHEFHAKEDVIIPPAPLALREATQAEVGRIKGEAMLLAGYKDKARMELIAPYIRSETDPALLAALGLFERTNGEPERAKKFLEAAAAGKVVRGEAYLELARIRYADAVAKPAGVEGAFSPAQADTVVTLLQTARQQPPVASAVYELLADTWTRSSEKPKREDALLLVEAAQRFPARLKLVYQTAVVCDRADLPEQAHALVAHGIKYAPTPAAKAPFEMLQKTLSAVEPAAKK